MKKGELFDYVVEGEKTFNRGGMTEL